MHPAIKIVNLVIFSVFITQGGWQTLFIGVFLLLPFYLLNSHLWASAIKMISKLKWFFLSIVTIYYYYTPHLEPSQQTISYINEGLTLGLFRILLLVVIIFAVNLFIKNTLKEEILSALLWLFSPLKLLKIDISLFLLRAVITLEYIEVLSQKLTQHKNNHPLQPISYSKNVLINNIKQKHQAFTHLIKHSGIILLEILKESESTSGQSYVITHLEAPMATQFIPPIGLCFLFFISL